MRIVVKENGQGGYFTDCFYTFNGVEMTTRLPYAATVERAMMALTSFRQRTRD